jgi:hypothetical protein
MTNAQRLYNQTCRHLQAVQANIDRLAELNANEELALLTGRPLNVRRTPNGAVLGALHNDTRVIVAETALAGGQKWARVVPEIGKQGWVFRNYLNCD